MSWVISWATELKEAFLLLAAVIAALHVSNKNYGCALFVSLVTLMLAMKWYGR